MTHVKLLQLTRENFAPFGELLMLDGAEHFPINRGSTERYHALSQVDVQSNGGAPIIRLFRGQAFQLPFQLSVMERHPLGSQAFIPLTKDPLQRYLVIVAKPCYQTEIEITQNLCAFIAHGFTGVSYAKGVWHHPLVSLDEVSDFIVVDRKGPGNNCDEIELTSQFIVDRV